MPKNTNLDLIRFLRDTKKLSLQDIRLIESHCKLGRMKENSLPDKATQAISLSFQINQAEKVAVVVTAFRLVCTYDDSEDGEPPLMLSANFGLRYAFGKPTSRKLLEEAAGRVAMLNVWPYWREFAQSTTLRMGLPAFPLPLIDPTRLKKSDADTEELKATE